MTQLKFVVEREVVLRAPRALAFSFFTDSALFARWWGEGSTIEPRIGGAVHIRYPGGVEAAGELLEIVAGRRVVFSYGFVSGKPIALGASRVTVAFEDHAQGTLVRLRHDLADDALRGAFVQGWRYQLALFANAAADAATADLAKRADQWFAAWSEADPTKRRASLEACAVEGVFFADRFSCTSGIDDLDAHLAAARVHMPGVSIARSGEARHCQGLALVDWTAARTDRTVVGRGTNVFELARDGRFARVVGFWAS